MNFGSCDGITLLHLLLEILSTTTRDRSFTIILSNAPMWLDDIWASVHKGMLSFQNASMGMQRNHEHQLWYMCPSCFESKYIQIWSGNLAPMKPARQYQQWAVPAPGWNLRFSTQRPVEKNDLLRRLYNPGRWEANSCRIYQPGDSKWPCDPWVGGHLTFYYPLFTQVPLDNNRLGTKTDGWEQAYIIWFIKKRMSEKGISIRSEMLMV